MGVAQAEVKSKVKGHVLESVLRTAGDLPYYSSGWARLPVGEAGTFLKAGSAGALSWATVQDQMIYKETVGAGTSNDWTLSGGNYYIDIQHDFNTYDVIVGAFDDTSKEDKILQTIDRTSTNVVRIWASTNTSTLRVVIAGTETGAEPAETPKTIQISAVSLDAATPPDTGVNANGIGYMDFDTGDKIYFNFHVPSNYNGEEIMLALKHSTSSNASYNRRFQATTRLIRPDTDAATGGNTQNFNTGDVAGNATSHMLASTFFAITSSGQVNSIDVSAGDFIVVTVSRVAIGSGSEAADAYLYNLAVEY